jgi:hypothetical protein
MGSHTPLWWLRKSSRVCASTLSVTRRPPERPWTWGVTSVVSDAESPTTAPSRSGTPIFSVSPPPPPPPPPREDSALVVLSGVRSSLRTNSPIVSICTLTDIGGGAAAAAADCFEVFADGEGGGGDGIFFGGCFVAPLCSGAS